MSVPNTQPSNPAVTQADIRDGLLSMGIGPGDVVFVHSSLSAFGHVDGGADTVIEAFEDKTLTAALMKLLTENSEGDEEEDPA